MLNRKLGKFEVSAIGLGCMPLSGMPESKQWILNERDKAIGVVHAALDAGVRLLDTADIYAPTWNTIGHNEILVMEALRTWNGTAAQKSEVVVATKGGSTRTPLEGDWFGVRGRDASESYLYRAVDRDGNTLDFMLSERRDLAAARRFFKRAMSVNGVPDRVVIDKSGANLAGLQAVNVILKFTGDCRTVEVRQVKYLNNILEQDHRFIKRITAPMMGFKAFHSAAATIAGIETAHMIRKGQFGENSLSAFQQFVELAA